MRLVLRIPDPRAPGLPRMVAFSTAAHALLLLASSLIPGLLRQPARPRWDPILIGSLVNGSDAAPGRAVESQSRPAAASAPPPPPAQSAAPREPAVEPKPKPRPEKPRDQKPTRPVAPTGKEPSTVSATESPGGQPAAPPDSGGGGPGGGAVGAPGADSGVGASFDGAAFPYAYYRSALENKIRASWQRPVYPAGGDGAIAARIRFRIGRDGHIVEVQVEIPSAYPALDTSALRAVHGAAPFPPLPPQFTEDSIGVSISFTITPSGI